jgi:von Willebrand factor type A domain
MKTAAEALVTDLSTSNPKKVKFGLVPFSHNVHVTLPGAYVRGATTASWTGCTADRRYPFNVSDSTPSTSIGSLWNQPKAATFASVACAGYNTHNLHTVDLTDDFKSVSSQLGAMTPYSGTHIAVGVEFGYHLLSPNAPFTTGASYSDKDTRKFMIVLTDGAQTMAGNGPGGTQSVGNAEANLEKLCASAKANGITIMTMAFDLSDSGTRKRLQNCATDANKDFFVVDDGNELASAFESVKAAVTAEVFLSK